MLLNPDEIFADLIRYREEIHAPEVHMDYTVKPFRFLLYNPANRSSHFHFMPCTTITGAQRDGTIANFRRTSDDSGEFIMYGALPQKLRVCNNCVMRWNGRFPAKTLETRGFDIARLFGLMEYDPHLWDGIDLPPEIENHEYMPGCFLLYRPVNINPKVFHFMKCKTVSYDEKIGWIKTYRFTNRTSGIFDMYSGDTQKLRPCSECLAEWNNGEGWKGYSSASDEDKKAIRGSFSVPEFFEHCNHQEHRPHELDELYHLMEDNTVWFYSVNNDYPKNWTEITNMYRAAMRYRCEECGVDMRNYPHLAITHHINGCHPDVSPENMKVLCVWCHSKQPHHAHTVRFTRYDYNLLRKLRSEQGIKMDDLQYCGN